MTDSTDSVEKYDGIRRSDYPLTLRIARLRRMTQTFRNLIDGELVDAASGSTYDVVNPATGQVYATAPHSLAEDVDRAF